MNQSCKNCGHGKHCGTPFYRQTTDYDDRGYSIEVCKCCRCDDCEKEDTK